MKEEYRFLGEYIRQVDIRNKEGKKENLLGVSVQKQFIQSIANTVGTDFTKYKVVKKGQFTYIPDTSRRGDKIAIALLEDYEEGLVSNVYTVFEVIDTEKLLPEYLMLWFSRPEFDRYARFKSHGSVREVMDWEEMCKVELPVPDIEKQRKIVKAYKTITDRIALKQKINDNLQQQLCLIYENMMCKAQYGNIEGTFTVASKLTDVVTGKEDANFASPNGKYKFFTCSNDTLNCDEYVFDSSAILIAGNGDFNVKHYSGKFNAYQRTYVLIPDHQYYGLLYFASLYQINSFKSASSGSIVKFITKGDIENIPVFIPNDEHILNELNRLLALQEKNQAENEELSSLRDWLLPMLMNGQASISD